MTRVLVRSVRNLVAGAQAVEEGDLDTIVAKTSTDEIGSLTDSFNHMIGELRLKERIKDTFGKYMDPRIVTRLLDRPEVAEPGGARRNMTVMFIDLKGFTSISEKLSPHDLVKMINRFFDHMTEAIAENGGVVDKFMGDAVMAFWGPPFTSPQEHGTLACRAALAAVARLDDFRAEVVAELGADARDLEIDLRIGVSTGAMIVGTVGSHVSKSFTVVGDPVNLGSRLEGANKAYGTHILVADETRAMTEDSSLQFREIDLLRVKGKNEPIRVFELVAAGSTLGEEECREFERGLAAYRAGDWEIGETAFGVVCAAVPDDLPSRTYIERIAHFRNTPPPNNWDGVWILDAK
ncbi:MAG: HAMP domain-containing protein [Alphaproteobacteria bacterium]|nr:HAMP domain-containing protein [Alphaproteobacteria bacterium]